MSKVIYLVGARAAGKSTIGKDLAQQLNLTFIDTDAKLLESTQQTVAEIVAAEGWPGFRLREQQILQAVTKDKQVIATGGGIVLAEANRQFMRQHGVVFYLYANAHTLTERLLADPQTAQRPSLTDLSLFEEVNQVLQERDTLYRQTAHYVLDATLAKAQIVQQILTLIQSVQY